MIFWKKFCFSKLKDNLHGGPKTCLWDHGGLQLQNHEFSKFWSHFKVSESFNVFWGNPNATSILNPLTEEIFGQASMLRCNKINVSIERWCWDCTSPWKCSNFILSLETSSSKRSDHQKKIWYPPLTFIHFEIFALLRPPPVRNGMDCDKSYKFSFELRCGLLSCLEVWRICAVA